MITKLIRNISLTILILSPLLGYFLISDLLMATSPMDKQPWVHWNGLNPSQEMYISWETSMNSSSYVAYGKEPNLLDNIKSDSTSVSLHRITLVNLNSNTKYYYQVSNDNGQSIFGKGSFTTAPSTDNFTNFSFAIISDTQNFMGEGHYPRMANTISKMNDIAFLAYAGDMAQDHGQTSIITPESDQVSWNDFWRITNRFTSTIPIVSDPGNHDDCNQPFEQNLYQRYFGISISPNHNYYSFNWSRTQFIMAQVADGGDDGKNNDSSLPTYKQDEWINATLEAGQSLDYRIMVFHRAPYSANGIDQGLVDRFMPIITKYNVSLLLYGHEHAYERFYIQNRTIMCLGGGGALLNGNLNPLPGSQVTAASPNFTKITCTSIGITITTYTPTMKIIDTMHFTKSGSQIIPDSIK